MIYLKYLRSLLRHKWYVFVEACKLGIPWLGLMHDLSKFRPDEFIPYARHFCGGKRTQEDVDAAYELAWLKHQRRNKHHWQWWVLMNDTDGTYPLPMPDRYRREMLADWRGAGRAYGNPNTAAWYLSTEGKGRNLHPDTKGWIEGRLGLVHESDWTYQEGSFDDDTN